MKRIILESLSLQNFKGIKQLSLSFGKQTNIFGANEAGKTTVFDAFNYLLFGKDSLDRKDFGIKNTVHPELNRQEHEVAGVLIIDDERIELKRIYKEKWTKPKGSTRAEHTGNVQEFYWNDVPMQAGQFSSKISEIVDETVFKLITNALYFNTLPWKKRREFLFKLAGEVSDNEVGVANPKFANLVSIISNKTFDGYKAEIKAKKDKLKKDLDHIPTRIDELFRATPEEKDFDALKSELKAIENSILDIDTLISDKGKANDNHLQIIQEKQRGIHKIKTDIQNARFEAESNFNRTANDLISKRSELSNKVETIKRNINSKKILMDSQNDIKSGLDLRRESLRSMFNSINGKEFEFDESKQCCPTCKRAFETQDIDKAKSDMFSNFMADKNKSLDEIDSKGIVLKNEAEACEIMVKTLTQAITDLESELNAAQTELENFNTSNADSNAKFDLQAFEASTEHTALVSKLKSAETELADLGLTAKDSDIDDLKARKSELNLKISALNGELKVEETIKTNKARIEELKDQETNFANQLAELEGQDHEMEEFTKAKIELIEERINGKFMYVKFKMYNYTIDGNPEETCETMYKGVPFGDLNTAGKVWAGMDIINTLSDHYSVYAPIFLDNRESVSLIPATDSQVVNLIVSPEDKQLRVA